MRNTVCLAIGVGDAPPLDYLRGAVNGAKAIDDWARRQRLERVLLTDSVDPVDEARISAALDELLKPSPDALILYFAGHGLSRGAGDDLWLLSQWHENDRAVSINGLRKKLYRYGLKRLILISDACRSPVGVETQSIEATSIIGRGPFAERLPQIDRWYAAARGRAAFMVPGVTPAGTRCIFSGLLAEALAGHHEAAFDLENEDQSITSYYLADFLEEEVPARASYYRTELNPEISTSIRPPNNRYNRDPIKEKPVFEPWPDRDEAALTSMNLGDTYSRVAPAQGESWSTLTPSPPAAAKHDDTYVAMECEPASVKRSSAWRLATLAFGIVFVTASLFVSLLPGSVIDPSPVIPPADSPDVDSAYLYLRSPLAITLGLILFGVMATLTVTLLVWGIIRGMILSISGKSNEHKGEAIGSKHDQADNWNPSRKGQLNGPSDFVIDDITLEQIAEVDAEDRDRLQRKIGRLRDRLNSPQKPRTARIDNLPALRFDGATAVSSMTGGNATDYISENGSIVQFDRPRTADPYSQGRGEFWRNVAIALGPHELSPLVLPLPVLVEISTGDWVGATLLPNYSMSVGVDKLGASMAIYSKSYFETSERAAKLMAEMSVRGLSGDDAREVVQALRSSKHADPLLGIIACWLHYSVGDFDNIRRTAYFFAQSRTPIPFDIALLGELEVEDDGHSTLQVQVPPVEEGRLRRGEPAYLNKATPECQGIVAGRFPFLRQGWDLLDRDGKKGLYPAGLAEISSELRPANFTTLRKPGAIELARLIFGEEI